jgi:hypothetical protein
MAGRKKLQLDVRNRMLRVFEDIPSLFDAEVVEITMRRSPDGFAESASEP